MHKARPAEKSRAAQHPASKLPARADASRVRIRLNHLRAVQAHRRCVTVASISHLQFILFSSDPVSPGSMSLFLTLATSPLPSPRSLSSHFTGGNPPHLLLLTALHVCHAITSHAYLGQLPPLLTPNAFNASTAFNCTVSAAAPTTARSPHAWPPPLLPSPEIGLIYLETPGPHHSIPLPPLLPLLLQLGMQAHLPSRRRLHCCLEGS